MYSIKTTDELSGLLTTHRHVVLKFTASWCKPCQNLCPILDDLQARARESCAFAAADVDTAPVLVDQFGVSQIPHVIVFECGVQLYSLTAPTKEQLEDIMQRRDMLAASVTP